MVTEQVVPATPIFEEAMALSSARAPSAPPEYPQFVSGEDASMPAIWAVSSQILS